MILNLVFTINHNKKKINDNEKRFVIIMRMKIRMEIRMRIKMIMRMRMKIRLSSVDIEVNRTVYY